jgi:holo-[acyl-carrier protein] synthase
MIYGIGTDLVEIIRIEQTIKRFGQRFIDRIFTAHEQQAAGHRKDKVRFYALRFAAKEAAWKALSPTLSPSDNTLSPSDNKGVGWHDLEISSNSDGKPELHFRGRAAEIFDDISGGGGMAHLSLSDDGGMALAFVVLFAP